MELQGWGNEIPEKTYSPAVLFGTIPTYKNLVATTPGSKSGLPRKLPRPKGSILFCTTGMLLQFMRSDPGLRNISHLILDEVHERDVISDFVITILKDVMPKVCMMYRTWGNIMTVAPPRATITAATSYSIDMKRLDVHMGTQPGVHSGHKEKVLCWKAKWLKSRIGRKYYLCFSRSFRSFKSVKQQEPQGWRKHLRHSKVKMREMDDYKDFIEPYVR
ncbi:hypothetical protein PR048_032166 [Dryococelus australis]|uniref:RNA helicase n=1 Tax=Dryococelus australis TaxID=614101 RepID=A0ABQ9G4P1_9NEOP|nr:hypothetical protein PR048_032166 [Dryococelus australis]